MTQRARNILMTLLIIAPFVLTMAFVRLFVNPADMSTANKGTLIMPHVQLSELQATKADGSAYTAEDTAGMWSMVYIDDGNCETRCKNALYYLIKQLRLSLDTDTPRVRRVIFHTGDTGAELRAFLDDNVAGMEEVTTSHDTVTKTFSTVFANGADAIGKIYIMSPDGQIILWYPSHDAQQDVLLEADKVRADLKRILKGSLNG